jgi:hypothetical protein
MNSERVAINIGASQVCERNDRPNAKMTSDTSGQFYILANRFGWLVITGI